MTLRHPPQWPMPPASTHSDKTLLSEAARILRNCETDYTKALADEIAARFIEVKE